MHRPATLIGIAVASLVLGAAPAAHAANPDVNHRTEIGGFSDPDFCGSGRTVDVSFEVNVVEFLSPNQDVDVALVRQGTFWLTNPETGATVQNHFAGRYSESLVSGDPAGIHTIEYTTHGLDEQLRLENGRVLSRDAGYHAWRDTLDGDNAFLSGGDVVNNGPHPDADSNFAIFCEVITTALGL
jgi:hypothetical protein